MRMLHSWPQDIFRKERALQVLEVQRVCTNSHMRILFDPRIHQGSQFKKKE